MFVIGIASLSVRILQLPKQRNTLLFQCYVEFLELLPVFIICLILSGIFFPSQHHPHIKVPKILYFKSSLNQFSFGTPRLRCLILLVCHLLACILSLFVTLLLSSSSFSLLSYPLMFPLYK